MVLEEERLRSERRREEEEMRQQEQEDDDERRGVPVHSRRAPCEDEGRLPDQSRTSPSESHPSRVTMPGLAANCRTLQGGKVSIGSIWSE